MKNKIEDLRNLLFAQLEKLADTPAEELDTEIERSVNMVHIAEVIVDSARAENEFLIITKGTGSGFIPVNADDDKKKLLQ